MTSRKRTALYVVIGVVVLAGLGFLLGGQVPMDDVTSAAEYKGVVGKRFRSQQELLAIGVTTDRNYKKQVDYVVLTAPPGFSGPEVVTTDKVAKGTEVRVIRVLKSSVPLISRVDYVVAIAADQKLKDTSVRVRQTGAVNDRNLGLDEVLYARVD
jgi:hypothetical protein